jgi:hypothetical protein
MKGFFVLVCFLAIPPVAHAVDPSPVAPAKTETAADLKQLVAPIALYPDALVGQILAASTYPDQVVGADRWMQAHSNLKGAELAKEVDQQSWDPSVKALTEYPSVLANMDKNLAWTSSLGDVYMNQPDALLKTVQTMRQIAKKAGTLKSTPQQTVAMEDQSIDIQPTNPNVVYLPQYNPWSVYGEPIPAYADWFEEPGIFFGGPDIFWGDGFDLGFYDGFDWGWPVWGCDWHHHRVTHRGTAYTSYSRTFVDRKNFNRVQAERTRAASTTANERERAVNANVVPNDLRSTRSVNQATRTVPPAPTSNISSLTQGRTMEGTHSTAFSGFNHGGATRSFSARGQMSAGRSFSGGGFSGGGGHGGGGGHR